MKKMINWRRFYILVFCISFTTFSFFTPVYKANAGIGDIIIGGDPLGTGGLFEGSFAGQAGIASIFAFLGLKAAQIDVHLTNEWLENGGNQLTFVQQKLDEWADGSPWFQTMIQGVRVAEDGIVYYQQSALDIIKRFGNWIVGESDYFYEGDPTINVPVESDIINIGDYQFASIPVDGSDAVFYSPNSKIRLYLSLQSGSPTKLACCVKYNDGGGSTFVIVSDASCIVNVQPYIAGTNVPAGSSAYNVTSEAGFYYTNVNNYHSYVGTLNDVPSIPYSTDNVTFVSGLPNQWGGESTSDAEDCFFGHEQDWSDFVPGLALPDGYMGAIDPGLLGQIQGELDQTKEYVLNLQDYIKSLEDSLNGEAVTDIPIQDTQNGAIEYIPDIPFETSPDYEQVSPEDQPAVEDTLPIVDDGVLASPDEIISSNAIDLRRFFPFCIPFDLYNLLNKFAADPVAPSLDVDLHVPIVNADIEYHFTLEQFSSVATILRNVELALLVVGLAVATRRIYLRG